jgi:cob(I)alamin adenosyltransferase
VSRREQERGLVQVYTGDGKGKTTAALGLALRAVGHGLRVCFIQFMKSDRELGERKAAARLAPELAIHCFAAAHWGDSSKAPAGTPWWQLPASEEDRKQAQEGIAFARRALTGGSYDLIVLDEIFQALRYGLISLHQLLDLISARAPRVELVLTGRGAPEEVIRAADLVTEMKAVKHPYERGVKARPGIEY